MSAEYNMDSSTNTLNGWSEWRHFTLSELKRLNDSIEKLSEQSARIDTMVAVETSRLKMYAAFWGTVAGFLASAIGMIVINAVFL